MHYCWSDIRDFLPLVLKIFCFFFLCIFSQKKRKKKRSSASKGAVYQLESSEFWTARPIFHWSTLMVLYLLPWSYSPKYHSNCKGNHYWIESCEDAWFASVEDECYLLACSHNGESHFGQSGIPVVHVLEGDWDPTVCLYQRWAQLFKIHGSMIDTYYSVFGHLIASKFFFPEIF